MSLGRISQEELEDIVIEEFWDSVQSLTTFNDLDKVINILINDCIKPSENHIVTVARVLNKTPCCCGWNTLEKILMG